MAGGIKIVWTAEMEDKVRSDFPYRFNADLSKEMGISPRSLIRKARELNVEKEPGFLDKNRQEISARATAARPANPTKGLKGWSVPGGEKYRFKAGERRFNNPEQSTRSRNRTIQLEKMRIKYGLPQKTKLKLVNIY